MLFSQLRRTTIKYARVILFYYVVLCGLLVLTPTGHQIVDAVGESYIDTYDMIRYQQAQEGLWDEFEALGNISRHHRYAEYKTQVWTQQLENPEKSGKLDKSLTRWANKNKRNIPMQLQLAQYYQRQNKHEKAFKLLRRLYAQVPDHPQLAKAYREAAVKLGHKERQQSLDESLQRYFIR